MNRRFALMLAAAASAVLLADDSQAPVADRPVLGYVYDEKAQGVRPIFGVAEAPRFGDPVPLPEGVAWLAAAPGQTWALTTKGDAVGSLDFNTWEFTPIADGRPDAWVFSPSGRAVGLYSNESHAGIVYSDLPLHPRSTVRFEAEEVSVMAVSDGGKIAAWLAAGKLNSASEESRAFVSDVTGAASLAFAPDSDALFVQVHESGILTRYLNALAADTASVVGEPNEGFEFLAISKDEILTAKATGLVVAMDREGNRTRSHETPPIRSLELMRIRGMRLLSFEAGSPAWLLTVAGLSAVPAVREVAQ